MPEMGGGHRRRNAEDCFGEQEAEMKRSLGLRFEDDEDGDDSEEDEA